MVVDGFGELRKEDEVMVEGEVDVEEDGIVKCRCGYDAKTGQGSTAVANIDIYPAGLNISYNLSVLCIKSQTCVC